MGYLLAGMHGLKFAMDKFEARRQALQLLVESFGHGGVARVAERIGKEPNYVSRMLYPEGKPGRKRIGEDSVDALNSAFPDWMVQSNQDSDVQVKALAGVVARLTTSGKMKPAELQNLIDMLKAREGAEKP